MAQNGSDLTAFLIFDYAQAELRILAEVSDDALLISQFRSGQDIHCLVGHALTGWPVERIAKEKNLRKMVKNMVFGVVYGIGRANLYDYVVTKIREIDGLHADLTGITPKQVTFCYDQFFKRYTGVARYVTGQPIFAEAHNYVESIFGFRRVISQDDETRDTYWGNQAINTPIQSASHTMLLIALALLHLKPVTYNFLQTLLMEVHDALYWLVRVRNLPTAYLQGKHLLETAVVTYVSQHFKRKLRVPFVAEAEVGFCMGSAVGYAGTPYDEWLPRWRAKHLKVEAESWEKLTGSV